MGSVFSLSFSLFLLLFFSLSPLPSLDHTHIIFLVYISYSIVLPFFDVYIQRQIIYLTMCICFVTFGKERAYFLCTKVQPPPPPTPFSSGLSNYFGIRYTVTLCTKQIYKKMKGCCLIYF